MSGLLRRLTRRRAAGPAGSEAPSGPAAGTSDASPTARVDPDGERSLLVDPGQAPGQGEPATPPAPPSDLPAGLDPAELERAPASSAGRGRLRRRLRFLRAARELLLRDLGGFVFELHRTASGSEADAHTQLRQAKLERLARVDGELRELERRLADPRADALVRVPGIGGECPECGELHASDASFCAHCGTPLSERARRARAKAVREEAAREERAREERAREESAREDRTHAERVREQRVHADMARATAGPDKAARGPAEPEKAATASPGPEKAGTAAEGNEARPDAPPEQPPPAEPAPRQPGRDGSPPAHGESRPAAAGDAPTQILHPEDEPSYAGPAERRP